MKAGLWPTHQRRMKNRRSGRVPRLARLYIYRQKTWFQISHARLAADTYCTPGEAGMQALSELSLLLSLYLLLQRVHAVFYFSVSIPLLSRSLFLSLFTSGSYWYSPSKHGESALSSRRKKTLSSYFVDCLKVSFSSAVGSFQAWKFVESRGIFWSQCSDVWYSVKLISMK